MPGKRPAYSIMGTPISSGNRGVLALGASLVNLCCGNTANTEITLLLGNRDHAPASFRVDSRPRPIPVVNCPLSPKSRLREHLLWIVMMAILYRCIPIPLLRRIISRHAPWIHAIEDSVWVGDVRGGDSFSDIYGLHRFLLGFLMAWTVILVKGSMVQFPQTYGPYNHWLSRSLARYLLVRSSVILARDTASRDLAQDLVGRKKQVQLSPDVAFSLESVQPECIGIDSFVTTDASRSVIGLNVSGLMYNGGYTRRNMFGLRMDYAEFMRDLVNALLLEHHGDLWLIPHTYASIENVESDNGAAETLRASLSPDLQSRVRTVTGEYDQHEIKWIIGQCDVFIGSRMHACIAALSQGIPCVGIAYSMKFAGVFETVEMADWVVDARSINNADALPRVLELYRCRAAVRPRLRQQADAARARLDAVFQSLFHIS